MTHLSADVEIHGHKQRKEQVMAQPKQTKGGGKDDDGTRKDSGQEKLKQTDDKPWGQMISEFAQQDREDGRDGLPLPDTRQVEEAKDLDDGLEAERKEDIGQTDNSLEADHQTQASTPTESEVDPGLGRVDDSDSAIAVASTTIQKDKPNSMSHKKIVRGFVKIAKDLVETGGMKCGDYGVDAIFNGDYLKALEPNSRKSSLYKQVFDDPDMPFDEKRTNELIRGAALRRFLIAEGRDVSHLTMSKLVALLPLKDPELRTQLAEEANTRNYSVRQIKGLVNSLNPKKKMHDLGKTIIRRIGEPLQMLGDQEFLQVCCDKQILLKDLSGAERRKILDHIKDGKSRARAFDEIVEALELALEEIEEQA